VGETAEALTRRLHERLATMVDELVARYPQPPSDLAGAWWWPASRGGAAPRDWAALVLWGDPLTRPLGSGQLSQSPTATPRLR